MAVLNDTLYFMPMPEICVTKLLLIVNIREMPKTMTSTEYTRDYLHMKAEIWPV